MRLLIIVNVFDPDRGGGAAVFSDMCYALAERGHEVTVRCAYPYYPEWSDKSGQNGLRVHRYRKNDAQIERYGLYIPSNPNSLVQRLVYEGSFFLSLLRGLPRGRGYDAVMVYCPLIGSVAYAAVHRFVFRQPVWLNVQDLSADAAAAAGIAKAGFVNRMLAGIQNWLFNRATVWSSISPVMIDRLRVLSKKNQPILFRPNWLNQSLGDEIAKLPSKVGRQPGDPVRLLYAGNIGAKQDLLQFIQTLAASDATFSFRIHGNGGGADDIRSWVEQSNDPRFTFGPFLDEAGFARALHETDYFVITERSGSGGSFIPSKMIPGMASGSAILAVSDSTSPLGREMREAEPGPWFGWDQLDTVADTLSRPALEFERWQQNAIDRAGDYARERIIDGFEESLAELARTGTATE
ncbi:MAG: glycosyltransferase [Bacteroidota bacterium]